MSESLRYPAQIFFSEEDEGYIAIAPDLPGCSAFGEAPDEALRELQDAIKAWIGAAKKAGNPVPPPSAREAEELPSGKVLLRLPKTLHALLIDCAARDGTSLNTCVVMLLSGALSSKNLSIHGSFARIHETMLLHSLGTVAMVSGISHLREGWQTVQSSGSFVRGGIVNRKMTRGGSTINLREAPAGRPVYLDFDNG